MTTLFDVAAGRDLVLHDWQEEAVQALRDNINARVKNQILAAPTGSGKTICATHLIKRCEERGQRAIFICDRRVLVEQTSDTFDMYGVSHAVYMPDHWRDDPEGGHPILVATAQTLERRGWPRIRPNLIVVDEAHGQRGFILERLNQREVVTVGLTATPVGILSFSSRPTRGRRAAAIEE